MPYDLPVHGEANWDTKLVTSMDFLKAAGEAAQADATQATADAAAAQATADAAETPAGAQAKADQAEANAEATAAAALAAHDADPDAHGLSAPWTPYSPTITAGGTLGNGTVTGGYVQIGKTVHFWGRVILGSTSSISGPQVSITLPVTARTAFTYSSLSAIITDSGTTTYLGLCVLTVTAVQVWNYTTAGSYAGFAPVSSTAPMTWVAGDEIEIHGTYEVA